MRPLSNSDCASPRPFIALKALQTLALIAVAGLLPAPARAATFTWDASGSNASHPTDGSGTWSTGNANWSNGATDAAWNNGDNTDNAVFGRGGTAGTVTVSSGVNVGNITFNPVSSGAYTIAGGTITLNGGTIATNAASATISSVLAGSVGLTTSGTGTLILAGNNTYTGATLIGSGTLQIGAGGAAGSIGSTNITDNGSLVYSRSDTINVSGTINGTGNLTLNAGAGTIGILNPIGVASVTATSSFSSTAQTLYGSAYASAINLFNNVTTTGNQTYNGIVSIGRGSTAPFYTVLTTTAGGSISLPKGVVSGLSGYWSSGSLVIDTSAGNGNVSLGGQTGQYGVGNLNVNTGSGTITLTGGDYCYDFSVFNGNVVLTGTSTFQPSVGGGAQWVRGVTFNGNLTGASTLTASLGGGAASTTGTGTAGLIFNTNTTQLVSSPIAGTSGLTKTGSGVTTLTGSSSYSGGTTISAGTLQLGDGVSNNGYVAGTITDNATLVFANPTAQTFAGVITGAGAVTVSGPGTLTLTGSSTGTVVTTINSGVTLQLGDGVSNNGSLSGGIVNNGALIFANPLAVTSSAAISSTGAITILGPGVTTLSGVNTYTSPTVISGSGTLQIGGAGLLGGGNYAANIANSGALVFNTSASQTLSGIISGTGSFTQAGTGSTAMSAPNSYTGGTIVTQGVLNLSSTSGPAIPGNVTFGNGSSSIQPHIVTTQPNQFNPGSIVSFLNNPGGYTRLEFEGNNQTLGGLSDALGGGVIQNGQLGYGGSSEPSMTLTLALASGSSYSYTGYMRDTDAGANAATQLNVLITGSGQQTLVGGNVNYTGATTVNSGTLVLQNATGFASHATVNSGGVLNVIGSTSSSADTVNVGGTLDLINNTSGFGSRTDFNQTVSGAGTINVSGGGWVMVLNKTNTINPTGQINILSGGLGNDGGSTSGFGTCTAPLSIASGAYFDLRGGSSQFDALTGAGGVVDSYTHATLTLGAANGSGTFSGTIVTGGGASGAGTGSDGGALSLVKTGTGTETLTGLNTYTGTTTVNGGTLAIQTDSSLTGAFTVNSGAVLVLTNANSFANRASYEFQAALSGSGTLDIAGGGFIYANSVTNTVTLTGGINIQSGVFGNDSSGGTTSAFGTCTAPLAISSGGYFDLRGGASQFGALSGSGSVVDSYNAATLTLGAANLSGTFSGAIVNGVGGSGATSGGGTGVISLVKTGAGTESFSGANTYTGTTTVNGGTLKLDFSGAGASASNIISSSSGLVLGGATLALNGGAAAANTQQFSGLTLNAGPTSQIQLTTNAAARNLALTLGAITRNSGATVNFTEPSGTLSSSNGILTSSGTSSAILTGVGGVPYATVNGNDWAAKDSSNTYIVGLSALSGYTPSTSSSLSGNADVANGVTATTLSGNTNITTLRFNQPQATTISLGGNTLTVKGILVTSAVANNLSAVTGGTLEGAAGQELVVFQNNLSNSLTVGAAIANNTSATGLTLSGGGTLALAGANSYTGVTAIDAGILQLSSAGALGGGGNVTFAGGTLQFSGSNTSDYSSRIVSSTGAISLDTNGQSVTFGSAIAASNTGGLTKTGAGTLTLTAASSYSGTTTVNNGTLLLQSASASVVPDASAIVITGGTMELNGSADNIIHTNADTVGAGGTMLNIGNAVTLGSASNPITLTGGVLAGSNSEATFGSYFFNGPVNVSGGTTSTISASTINPNNTTFTVANGSTLQVSSQMITSGFTKAGTGTMLLTGASTYTGGTVINSGTLQLGNGGTAGSISSSSAISGLSGGTLVFDLSSSGTFSNSISGGVGLTQEGTGTITLTAGNSFTGSTAINSGTLRLLNGTASSSPTTVNAGGTLLFDNNGNTWQFGSPAISLNGGTLSYYSSANAWTVLATGAVTSQPSSSSTITLQSGYISGSGAISSGLFLDGGLQGSGTVTVNNLTAGVGLDLRNNNSTFSGMLVVNGIASTTSGSGSGIGVGGCTVGLQNADIGLNGTMELLNVGIGWANSASGFFSMGALSGTGVMIGDCTGTYTTTVTLGSNGHSGTFSGVIADGINNTLSIIKNGAGTQTLTGNNTYSGSTTINAGTLQLGNGVSSIGTLIGNINNMAKLVFANPAAQTYGGIISGNGSVAVSGPGVLTLTGGSTYTGATNVTGGTLVVAGSLSSNQVNVIGGTLAGIGSIAGNAVIGTGSGAVSSSIVDPSAGGGSAGSALTIGGNLTLNSDAVFQFQLNSDESFVSDTLVVSGTLTLNGAANFTGFDVGGGIDPNNIGNTYEIAYAYGGIIGDFANAPVTGDNVQIGYDTYSIDYTGNEIDLTLEGVPEPRTWATIIGGFGMLAGICRFQRGRRRG